MRTSLKISFLIKEITKELTQSTSKVAKARPVALAAEVVKDGEDLL